MKDENVLLGCTRVERIHKSTLSSFRYTSPRETRHYTGLSITINRSNCSQVYSHPGFTWQQPGDAAPVDQPIDFSVWPPSPLTHIYTRPASDRSSSQVRFILSGLAGYERKCFSDGPDEVHCRRRQRPCLVQARHGLTFKECGLTRMVKVVAVEFQLIQRVNLPRESHVNNTPCKTLLRTS